MEYNERFTGEVCLPLAGKRKRSGLRSLEEDNGYGLAGKEMDCYSMGTD
jgi:hypothetical protein